MWEWGLFEIFLPIVGMIVACLVAFVVSDYACRDEVYGPVDLSEDFGFKAHEESVNFKV